MGFIEWEGYVKCGYGAMMLLITQALHYLKCGYGAMGFREWEGCCLKCGFRTMGLSEWEGCYVKCGYGAMRAWEIGYYIKCVWNSDGLGSWWGAM